MFFAPSIRGRVMQALDSYLSEKQKEFDEAVADLKSERKHAISRAKVIHEQKLSELVEDTVSSIIRKFM